MPNSIESNSQQTFEISPIEKLRNNVIKHLETEFPSNPNKVTKVDIINLSLTNACLAIYDKFPNNDEEELKSTKVGLEMERDVIVYKILGLVASSALSDSLKFPSDDYIYRGIEQYADILDKVDYLVVTSDEPDEYIDYNQLLLRLRNKLTDSPNHKEMNTALRLAKNISRFSTWKGVSEKSLDVLRLGADVGRVEQLIQEIHQGGHESLDKAEGESRPILEYIADRPWEVANALTFTFAGYPNLAGAKLKSSVNKYTQPYRESPIVREYYHLGEVEFDRVRNAARGDKFLEASLSLAKNLDVNDIEKMNFFVDPYTASEIIEGEK